MKKLSGEFYRYKRYPSIPPKCYRLRFGRFCVTTENQTEVPKDSLLVEINHDRDEPVGKHWFISCVDTHTVAIPVKILFNSIDKKIDFSHIGFKLSNIRFLDDEKELFERILEC